LNGGSASLHSITHKTYKNIGKDRWKMELENNYKSLIELGFVNNIPGSRAPQLSFDNDYLQVLLEMGIQYDSSMFQC
jgi:Polysaccharide deacetylase